MEQTFDKDFVTALEGSQESIYATQRLMAQIKKGASVVIPAIEVRPKYEDRKEFTDSADLYYLAPIEVKQRDIEFTDENDYPYPTVYIDTLKAYARKKTATYAYVIWNKQLTHAIWINVTATWEHWQKRRYHNEQRHHPVDIYEIPVKHVKFICLKTSSLSANSI